MSPQGESLTGFSAIDFDDSVSDLMHHLKEGGVSALAKPIGLALVQPLCELLLFQPGSTDDALWLVPAAGGIKSLQRRGYAPATLIAKSLLVGFDAEARKSAGPRALIWGGGLVWRKHEVSDQAGLSGLARQTNLVGAMQGSSGVANKSIVLVDDIVTTGSTLFETARALRAEGATVLGFVTFAETVLRSFAKSDAID